jgi:hypothetical protein
MGAVLVHPVAVVRQPGKQAERGLVKPCSLRLDQNRAVCSADGRTTAASGMGQAHRVSSIPEPESPPEAWFLIFLALVAGLVPASMRHGRAG